jgi:hypothetical protein
MNPNLIALAEETKNPELMLDVTSSKYYFVPELGLYVPKEIECKRFSYRKMKKYAKKTGQRMLTPAEWWVLYDKYADVFFKSKDFEFLDAIVYAQEDLIIGCDWFRDDDDVRIQQVYKGVVRNIGRGSFKRQAVDEHGIPTMLDTNCTNLYSFPTSNTYAPMFVRGVLSQNESVAFMGYLDSLDEILGYLGARLCIERKNEP